MRERRKKAQEAARLEKREKAQEAARQYARNMAQIKQNNIRMRELEAQSARDAIEASKSRAESMRKEIQYLDAATKVLALSGWGPGVNPGNMDKLEEIDGVDDTDDTDSE
jgi:hypothetical protein